MDFNDNLYDKEFLRNTLDLLQDLIGDLSKWSAWNDDKYNQEVHDLQEIIKNIKLKENN